MWSALFARFGSDGAFFLLVSGCPLCLAAHAAQPGSSAGKLFRGAQPNTPGVLEEQTTPTSEKQQHPGTLTVQPRRHHEPGLLESCRTSPKPLTRG